MNVAGLEKHRSNHGDGGSDNASREGEIARSTVTSGEGGGHRAIRAGRTISTVGRGTGARIIISTPLSEFVSDGARTRSTGSG